MGPKDKVWTNGLCDLICVNLGLLEERKFENHWFKTPNVRFFYICELKKKEHFDSKWNEVVTVKLWTGWHYCKIMSGVPNVVSQKPYKALLCIKSIAKKVCIVSNHLKSNWASVIGIKVKSDR